MDKNNEIDSKKQLALLRHSAVSFIEEMRREGMSMPSLRISSMKLTAL